MVQHIKGDMNDTEAWTTVYTALYSGMTVFSRRERITPLAIYFYSPSRLSFEFPLGSCQNFRATFKKHLRVQTQIPDSFASDILAIWL